MIPAPLLFIYNEDGGTGLGALQGVSTLTVSDVFCDLGSMTFTVPKDVPGMSLLLVDADRQVALRLPGCPDQWFLADSEALTYVSDDATSEPVTVNLRSLSAVLDEAKVFPMTGISTYPADWAFWEASPGQIIEDLFTDAQNNGMCQNVSLTGDALVDAGGLSWTDTYTATYAAGTSLLDVLKSLSAINLVEWRMNGRALEIYQRAGGLDRTLTTPLRPREDVTAAPYVRDKTTIATDVLVTGNDSLTTIRTQLIPGRRRRMAFISQTNAPGDSVDQVGDLYLAAHSTPDVQMTHEVTDGPTTVSPWKDYRCGDRIPTLAGGSGVTLQRISQIALAYDETGAKVTLELGSILATAEEIFDRQLRNLLPGDSIF